MSATQRRFASVASEVGTLTVLSALAAGVAWASAQVGPKGATVAFAVLVSAAAFVVVRDRSTITLVATVLAIAVPLHKSLGPIVDTISSGAPSVYVTVLDVGIVALYLLWLAGGSMGRDLAIAFSRPVVWIPLLAAFLMTFSVLVATNVTLSIAELVRWGWMYLLYLYLAARIHSRRDIVAVLAALAAIGVVELAIVLMQWRTGGVLGLSFLGVPTQLGERTLDAGDIGRPFGTVVHPVFMAALMGTLALLALGLGLNLEDRRARRWCFAMLLVCVAPIVIANARASAVAFAIAAAALCVSALVRRHLSWRVVGWSAVAAAAVLIASWPLVAAQFRDNFGTNHFELEIRSRLELNHVGVEMFLDHPIIGVGLNNFEQVMQPYERYGLIFADNPVHNLGLLQLSETGIVGAIGMVVLAAALIRAAWVLRRSTDRLLAGVGYGALGVYLFFILEEQLGFSLRQDAPLAVFWIVAGLVAAALRMSDLDALTEGWAATARGVPVRIGGLPKAPAADGRPSTPYRQRSRLRGTAAIAAAVLLAGSPVWGSFAPAAYADPLAGLRIVFSAYDRSTGHHAIFVTDPGGTPVRITPNDGADYSWPNWAFDGARIVYTMRRGPEGAPENIFLMASDGSHVQQLTFTSWRNAQPQISPDGRTLLFTSMWPEYPKVALYEMDLRTHYVINLTALANTAGGFDSDPKWSTSGNRIVFANGAGRTGTVPTQTFLMDADGSDRLAVTHDRYFNTDPELSPGGGQVAIASYRGHGSPALPDPEDPFATKLAHWYLIVRSLSNGAERTLTLGKACFHRPVADPCGPAEGPAYVPTWTPDGSALGFISILSARHVCICVVRADGSSPGIAFESTTLAVTWFDWIRPGTPPGSLGAIGTAVPADRLLYGGQDRHGAPFLAVSMPDRWGDIRIPIPGGLIPTLARWMPNRHGIIFTANVPYDRHRWRPYPKPPPGRTRHVHFTLDFMSRLFFPAFRRPNVSEQQTFLYDLRTGEVRQLTTPWIEDYMDALPKGDVRGNIDGDLSPDGRQLMVTNVSSATNESFILRLDLRSGQVYNITNATAGAMPTADSGARYSPDGSRIVFTCTVGTQSQICETDARTGKSFVQLTNDDNFNTAPAWDPTGRFIVYSSRHASTPYGLSDDPAALADEHRLGLDGWWLVKLNVRTGEKVVLTRGTPPAFRPVWSPDGRHIAFIGFSPPGQPDLYIVNPDGSGLRPLQATLESHEVFVDWR